ncbi:MAG: ShlB/FhaC/HecB family hemolysin secretion/activation protein [Pseudomonadota bacterium]
MLNKITLRCLCFVSLLILGVEGTIAQTPPDAGSLRQDIEDKDELPKPKKSVRLGTPKVATETAAKGTSVTVKSFYFSGNTTIKTQALKDAVAPLLDRPLTFAELETATALVAETYRQAGWIARAYFPPQDIDGGSVAVTVVESIFGETHLNGDEPRRISSKRLIAIVSAQQTKGQLLSADGLESALRRMNDLPGISVTGVLNAGQKVRETDLLLKVNDEPVVTGDVTLDNFGSLYTGEERVSSTIFLNSPFAYGEQMLVSLLHSDGIDYGQFAATLPVGISGFRVGAHASTLDYELVKELDPLGARGNSTALGIDVSYPLLRSRSQNLSFLLSLDDASYENETALTPMSSEYNVSALTANLNGYFFDSFAGGGVNQASLIFTAGNAKADDGSIDESEEGSFKKTHYSISRQQQLMEWLSLYGSLVGQFADKNLTSSEKFTLGGVSGVRAYTSTHGSGDAGNLLTIEVRASLPYRIQLTGFYDMGKIKVDKNPEPATLTSPPNDYTLKGAGISTSWTSESGLHLKATWATRIGDNPLEQEATGIEEDNLNDKNRIWLQASMKF